MLLSDFDFDLPQELIAQHPASPRDAARLLVVGETLEDRVVRDLPALLRRGDLLVYNDTQVIKARLVGRRRDATVEVTLHRRVDERTWDAFARPARKLAPGDTIVFADDFAAEIVARGPGGEVGVRFDRGFAALMAALDRHGRVPLPPYIKRPKAGDPRDAEDYRTLWGVRPGAVAAATAGLHFTPELLAALDAAGIGRTALTLHVGAGTFLPVTAERIEDHRMHAEWGEIGAGAAAAIAGARQAGGRIVAVGTTAARLLETVSAERGAVEAWSGETRLFVTPGFRWRAVDLLLTNFHLPRSTLFMLVCAFAGRERMRAAYAHAISRRYRFFSYGDACLLSPEAGA